MKNFIKTAAVSAVLLWGLPVFAQKATGSAGKFCSQISNLSKEVATGKLIKAETFNETAIKGTSARAVAEGDGKSEDWIVTQAFGDNMSTLIYETMLKKQLTACFGEPNESTPYRTLIWSLANKTFLVLYDEKTSLHLRITKSTHRNFPDAKTKAEMDKTMRDLLDYVPTKKD